MGESAEMSFVTSVNVKIRVWSFIANLFPNRIQEQYAKLKLTEEGLQAAQSNCSAREKAAEVRALFAVKGQKKKIHMHSKDAPRVLRGALSHFEQSF